MTIRWQLTDEIFNEALNVAPAHRSDFLTEACGPDEDMRRDVESLLLYASDSESYLLSVVDETARDLSASLNCSAGSRIGPYVVLREIGHGGMGTVYLAARADGHFEQKVALKIINVGIDPGFALEHFLRERQVLANLQHANIARLLDGGTTETGQPYFAMEFLEGEPLTQYFSRCGVGLPERLEIFEQVCSAIHHAHRQLVIHRDLKPDNVLVTKEGVAKLLDFGIAKLLGDETVGERFMTPVYASPEQFRGEASSTACDIYSLGAVLYEVISGRRPFDLQGKDPDEIQKTICNEYPSPLPGDLGDIVRMAMDKDPARRYASAEALAEDLRRYRNGLPVLAHSGGSLYWMSKFVARNRVLSAVAVILLISILTGSALIVHEANIAWRRAAQVRDLADKLLTGFNQSGDEPESTAQRAQRVRQALDSLGTLSAGTRADSTLDLKIAIAYEHVGDAQGDPMHRSLGDSAGAERSYRAAIAILDRLVHERQPLPAAQSELWQADYRLAMLLRATGSAKESLNYFLRAAQLADAAIRQNPADRHLQYEAGSIYGWMARVLKDVGRLKDSASATAHAVSIFENLVHADPANPDYRDGQANCYAERGALAVTNGKLEAGLEDFRRNLQLREALAAEFPNSAAARENVEEKQCDPLHYVARESATHEVDSKALGFDNKRESIDIAAQLGSWQNAGDEKMKFIVSPEFGDRVDMKHLTRELMTRVGRDIGESHLEWIAVAHYNTEHPHVHIALRGIDNQRQSLHLGRDYVKSGIRNIAEDLCTNQLGYRTEFDAGTAERREVSQHRYTSLDRMISRGAGASTQNDDPQFFMYTPEPPANGIRDGRLLRQQHATERLLTLQTMGLAECSGPNTWLVRRDFESVLRSMQRMKDRQKTLAAHGVLMSDERLPVTVLDYRDLKSVEGRVLVHGEEEVGREAGRSYLMLEGTDVRVHHIYYTAEMEEARNRGKLRTNSFVRLRKVFVDGQPAMEIDDFGDSEAVLHNRSLLKQIAQTLIRRGIIPEADGWGGWLGRYQTALRNTVLDEVDRQTGANRRPERDGSHGR